MMHRTEVPPTSVPAPGQATSLPTDEVVTAAALAFPLPPHSPSHAQISRPYASTLPRKLSPPRRALASWVSSNCLVILHLPSHCPRNAFPLSVRATESHDLSALICRASSLPDPGIAPPDVKCTCPLLRVAQKHTLYSIIPIPLRFFPGRSFSRVAHSWTSPCKGTIYT